MSSHVGASGVNGSSRVGGRGAEDASEDNSNNETYTPCLKALRQRSRCADPAGEGRSSGVEQLPNTQTRSTPSSRTAAGDLHHHSFNSSREPDPFWVDVRRGAGTGRPSQSHHTHNQTHNPSFSSVERGEEEEEEEDEEEEEEEEEVDVEDGEEGGSGVMEVLSQTVTSAAVPPCVPFGERRMSKREKNRIKCLRRRQRRRERWRQSQLQESRQSSTGNPSSSSSEDDEDVSAGDREGYICAVCLDVYFSPYMCHPCNHIFCEPCLRTLAKNSPTNTPCPLCRTIITHVFFQKELNQTARTFFPKEYLSRKQNFQKASCAKWPLPSCRKLFRIFGGFQRQSSPMARRQFPHGGGYRLDAMDFEDDSRGWRFDMDMVIIYIYSVNWIIGFFIFCFLCYLFFPSF
ncbi:E3 ubiquitin-protein ligase RNF180 [Acanthopagrus schlegelii]